MIKITWHGIVQGSILGPILYAIFVSPLFDIENLTCFADDKFPLVWNKNKLVVIRLMEIKLDRIMKWLTDSGMKVNESRTDLCLTFTIQCKEMFLNELYQSITVIISCNESRQLKSNV